jgi:hypothetical protein
LLPAETQRSDQKSQCTPGNSDDMGAGEERFKARVYLLAKTQADILKAKKSPPGNDHFAPVLAIRLAFVEIYGYPPAFKLNP